jgi:hypothetical protein
VEQKEEPHDLKGGKHDPQNEKVEDGKKFIHKGQSL